MTLRWLCAAATVGLCACATQVPTVPLSDVASVVPGASVALPDAFFLRARVSVRRDREQDSFTLEWTRTRIDRQRRDVMRVVSPFGLQIAELTVDARGAVLQRGSERFEAPRMGTLTDELIGVAIEPEMLLAWLRVPKPDALDDWQVSSDKFAQFGDVALATRVVAVRDTRVVRVVLDEFVAH